MVGFDDTLGEYRPPRAGDIEVTFAPKRTPRQPEPKPAEALPGAGELPSEQTGEHGGSETSAGSGGGSANGSSSGGADQITQRDEPDEGEHTDSTEEQVAARAAAAEERAAEEAPAAPATVEQALELKPEPEPVAEEESAEAPAEKQVEVTREELGQITGSQPVQYQKTGFSAGGVETVLVKRIPEMLVDRLRLTLASTVGGAFAEQLSAPALITAFLMAKTGMGLQVDANTSVAVDAFRQSDPGLLSVERRLDEVLGMLTTESERSAKTLQTVRETGEAVDGLENSVAYLVGDRVTRLSTTDVDETNVDVTQKKVLVVRERIRERTKEQRKLERDREGREIHRRQGRGEHGR